jgi:hypothetical protein
MQLVLERAAACCCVCSTQQSARLRRSLLALLWQAPLKRACTKLSLEAPHAGHLYAPGDYAAATELARRLVLDEAARRAMGAAARAHVEKLGWMAAVKRIRDTQYQRAIRTFRAHKRCSRAPCCCCGLAE